MVMITRWLLSFRFRRRNWDPTTRAKHYTDWEAPFGASLQNAKGRSLLELEAVVRCHLIPGVERLGSECPCVGLLWDADDPAAAAAEVD